MFCAYFHRFRIILNGINFTFGDAYFFLFIAFGHFFGSGLGKAYRSKSPNKYKVNDEFHIREIYSFI